MPRQHLPFTPTGSRDHSTLLMLVLAQLALYSLVGLAALLLALRLARVAIASGSLRRRIALLSRTALAGAPSLSRCVIVAFFHPHADAGGGGERVLWTAVRATLDACPHAVCVIYSGEAAESKEAKAARVATQFGIAIDTGRLEFVYLARRKWVEAARYPRFTLLGQSLGSMLLAWEALAQLTPDVFVDTTGYAFAYPLAKFLAHARVVAYVHYPLISTDMLDRVRDRVAAHNNRAAVSSSSVLSSIKWLYYRAVAFMYGIAGRCADLALVNSSWTRGHIQRLWGAAATADSNIALVYPPCDLAPLLTRSPAVLESDRRPAILSVAQFRPEKDHPLMIRAFAQFLAANSALEDDTEHGPRLVLVGGCRNTQDQARVDALRRLAKELAVDDRVEFVVNAPVAALREHLLHSTIALHAMWNEHFGISVAEYLAAGLITIAHNSAGPKMDIVRDGSGFLASTEEEYAECMTRAWRVATGDEEEVARWRERARRSVAGRFAEAQFIERWQQLVVPIIQKLP